MGEKAKKVIEQIVKNTILRKFLPIVIIVVLILVSITAMDYKTTIDDGTYREGDMSSTPYVASTYINSIKVEKDGTLKNEKTAQELWDEMIKNGNRVDRYLSSPKELARLMKAEIVTQYPDTREDPDKEIDWKKIKKDEDLLQGIIKFKRASDGQTASNATTMSYVDPATFQAYVEEYNNTGSESAKENALKHFTLKQTKTSTVRGNTGIGEFEKYNLTEDELKALATVALQEQGQGNGAGNAAELSLMVNLYEREKSSGKFSSVYDYVKNSGWFNAASSYMDSFCTSNGNGSIASNPEVLEYARIIIVQGKRTLPGYVDEHDSTLDIAYVTNDGASIDKNSPSQYIQFTSIIHQGSSVGSGQWTYYCHPTPQSDPFGYTSEERRAQIGELYYEFGTWEEVNGTGKSNSSTKNNSSSNNNNKDNNSSNDKNQNKDKDKNNSSKENTKTAEMDAMTDVSQAILDAINKTPSPGAGLCQKWVDDVYENAGLSLERCNSAYDSYKANGVSTDRDNIPIGAAVYGTGTGNSGPYGHVGIYIGDGKVVDNVGPIQTQTLDEWVSWQENKPQNSNNVLTNLNGESTHGWLGWGWADGNKDRVSTGSSSNSNTNSGNSGNGYVAIVATWSKTKRTLTTNDPNVSPYDETQYTMTTTTVNYQSMVEKYVMPFDFLWALMVTGEEKNFVFELTDLVFDSDIQVTIYDNLTTNTNVDDWHYELMKKTEADIHISAYSLGESASRSEMNHSHESSYPYRTTKTITTNTNSINAILTRANTWIVDYINDYSFDEPSSSTSENTAQQSDQDYPENPESTGTQFSCELTEQYKQEVISEVREKAKMNHPDFIGPPNLSVDEHYSVRYYSKYVKISDAMTTTVETNKYTEGTPQVREKTDKDLDEDGNPKELNFVTIFRKAEHAEARKNILSASEWLFTIVEENGKPDVDLVRYLLYKATGKNFGITEYDFSQYDASKFSDTTGLYGDTVQEQVWWALIDAGYSKIAAASVLGNIQCESGFDPASIEEGNGIGLGLCQWSYGRRTQLEGYIASKGTNTSDVQTQIEFLLAEINPSGGANGYAEFQMGGQSSSSYDGTSYTKDDWKNSTNLGRATTAFMALFERPDYNIDKNHLPRRKEAAQKYYDQFKNKEKPTADSRIGPLKITGSNAEKMKQMLTEALRIADDDRYYYSQDNRWGEFSYDCSSFVYRLYKQYFGLSSLATTTDEDYTSLAKKVITNMSANNLEPGDVLWRSGHVAIYIGNGQYVHASGTTNGILVSTYDPGRFTKAFRYVE